MTGHRDRRRSSGITLMELLIVCVIGSIVTGGLIMLWFNITRSAAMTTSHAEARDFARDGIARLSREIRDAEALPGEQAIVQATAFSISFTTTFNKAGSEIDTTLPRLVRYRYDRDDDEQRRRLLREVYAEGELDPDATPVRTDVVIPHMLNGDADPIFSYTYLDADGVRRPAEGEEPILEVSDDQDLARILLVRIRAVVDLDPGKAPSGMDVTTQAQLRNQRIIE